MKVFTIGFTKKSAETFFGKLKRSGAKHIVDVRLNNVSQLAGFAKRNDLQFFYARAIDWQLSLEIHPPRKSHNPRSWVEG